MKRTPTELVHHGYEALNRRDLDEFLASADPEVEFVSLIAEAEGATFRGHEGVREWWTMVAGSLGGIRFAIEGTTEVSDELVLAHLVVTGEAAGVEVSQRMWQAIEVRDEKAVWWQAFRTEEEGLEALRARLP